MNDCNGLDLTLIQLKTLDIRLHTEIYIEVLRLMVNINIYILVYKIFQVIKYLRVPFNLNIVKYFKIALKFIFKPYKIFQKHIRDRKRHKNYH